MHILRTYLRPHGLSMGQTSTAGVAPPGSDLGLTLV